MAVLFGIKATDRVKSFLFRFIAVPAKWIKTARQYKLNIYSEKPYDLIWEKGKVSAYKSCQELLSPKSDRIGASKG